MRQLPPLPAGLVAALPATARPDVVLAPDEPLQPSLPLASDGVQRWVWHSRYGAMLIEVVGADVFVNGQRVEPHAPRAGGDILPSTR